MYIKYIVNYWSVNRDIHRSVNRDIHSKANAIYVERGLVAWGGFCLYPGMIGPTYLFLNYCNANVYAFA